MTGEGNIRAARRYAHALFGASRKAGEVEAVQADVEALTALWDSTPALREALTSPLITADAKTRIIDQTLGDRVRPLTAAFLRLAIAKRREAVIPAVRDEFIRLADADRGVVRAHATSAVPLDQDQVQALRAGLEKRTGRRVVLTVSADPAILGGVTVQIEDIVIDGSVRGALERLRERMLAEA